MCIQEREHAEPSWQSVGKHLTDRQGGKTPHNTKFYTTKSVQHVSRNAHCQLDSPVAFEASLDLSLARLQAPL